MRRHCTSSFSFSPFEDILNAMEEKLLGLSGRIADSISAKPEDREEYKDLMLFELLSFYLYSLDNDSFQIAINSPLVNPLSLSIIDQRMREYSKSKDRKETFMKYASYAYECRTTAEDEYEVRYQRVPESIRNALEQAFMDLV